MGDVMKPLARNPVFAEMILKLGETPVLGLLVGTIMTVLIQSSSATIGVLQNLASQPVAEGSTQALISLNTAIPILLGDNIGTTITAVFASIGAKVNAKRAAAAHSVFNIAGALIFIWFIPVFAKFVETISPKGAEINIIARQIANAHTAFNVANTLLWLPFVWLLAKIVTFIVRGKEDTLEKRVLHLDKRVLNNPSVAMDLATKELSRMASFAREMMACANKAFTGSDLEEAKKVRELEEVVDMLQYEIVNYLSTMLSQGTLTERQSIRLAGLMHVAGDIERIGDHCENIADFAELKQEEGIHFSTEALEEIGGAFDKLNEIVDDSIRALHDGNLTLAKKVIEGESEVDELEITLRTRHIERLNNGLCNPVSAITFIELIHNLERIADHCRNIAEALIDDQTKQPRQN
jgi:phosphate:Na+ symporter